MAKYIFVLGKNWRLSIGELLHILNSNGFNGKIFDYSACVAIIEFDKGILSEKQIAELQFILGGTLKIGKVVDFIDYKTFIKSFPYNISDIPHPGVMLDARKKVKNFIKDSIYPIFGKIKKNEKYFFANSIYPIEFRSPYYRILTQHFLPFLNKLWPQYLKERGARTAIYFKYPEQNMKNGTLNPIFPHHFFQYELYKPTKREILYCLTEEGLYIGYTLNATNSNMLKMIDEERPYKRFEASIPPKFAKIMINLLNLKKPYNTMRILDPFVGSGTILLFAYSMGIQVYGSDSDMECVIGTRRNLNWIKKFLEKPLDINFNSTIINANINVLSEKFKNMKFHGIVTEPLFVPILKELPHYENMIKIVNNQIIPSYEIAFREFDKLLKAGYRVSITSPLIETLEGEKINIDLKPLAEKYGFKNIDIINKRKITEKSDRNLRLVDRNGIISDKSSLYLYRQFFVFEKNKK
ncbi:MAG: TRM11 family SAM-dependent methyltransferase [Promethearchaeota archaeon]